MRTRRVAALAMIVILYGPSLPVSAQPAGAKEVQAAQAASPPAPPQRKGQINITLFGKTLRLELSVGLLGILVIIMLAVLSGLALLFGMIARRRLREARAANQKLHSEVRERFLQPFP